MRAPRSRHASGSSESRTPSRTRAVSARWRSYSRSSITPQRAGAVRTRAARRLQCLRRGNNKTQVGITRTETLPVSANLRSVHPPQPNKTRTRTNATPPLLITLLTPCCALRRRGSRSARTTCWSSPRPRRRPRSRRCCHRRLRLHRPRLRLRPRRRVLVHLGDNDFVVTPYKHSTLRARRRVRAPAPPVREGTRGCLRPWRRRLSA